MITIYRPKSKHKMDGVFYWIVPGQIWITDCLWVRLEKMGLQYKFVPWSSSSDPYGDFEFNESLDANETYADIVFCNSCNSTTLLATAVDFTVKNSLRNR